ncbi:MAG: lipoate-protein ligase A [Planctomycetota bacterium]|jgi:lipoate-protein ligase A
MERWRSITSWDGEPSFHMGLDEALLEDQLAPLTLRFYDWRPRCLSLGYFQRFADVPAASTAEAVVRRITGGGAIHHTEELTFSIVAPLSHPLYRGPVAASYERVHGQIARALSTLGEVVVMRRDDPVQSDASGTGMCFHESTPLDLVWGGRKGVGSAQRRRNGRVLHHGSIKLEPAASEAGVAGLREHAPELTREELRELLLGQFEQDWGASYAFEEPTPIELTRARELGARYPDPAFVQRR